MAGCTKKVSVLLFVFIKKSFCSLQIPVNALIVCMYNFQQFFCHSVDLAMKGVSEEFVLKKRYLCYKKTPKKNLPTNETKFILKPDEIVEIVRESLNSGYLDGSVPSFDSIANVSSSSPTKRPCLSIEPVSSAVRLRSQRTRIPNPKYRDNGDNEDDDDDIEDEQSY